MEVRHTTSVFIIPSKAGRFEVFAECCASPLKVICFSFFRDFSQRIVLKIAAVLPPVNMGFIVMLDEYL